MMTVMIKKVKDNEGVKGKGGEKCEKKTWGRIKGKRKGEKQKLDKWTQIK